MQIFFAFLAAIVIGVFIYAPERLPTGIGLKPLPMAVTKRPSFLTLGSGTVAVIQNKAPVTLYNVKITCNGVAGKTKTFFKEAWKPNESYEIGAFQGWVFEKGESLDIAVSGYLPYSWNF